MKTESLTIILILFKFVNNSDGWLLVTGADEPVYAHVGEDVTLSCSVDTHVNVAEIQVEWIKTDDDGDIMVLLFADGENRPESQDGRYSGRAEFFTEEIPKGNFSMKLRKVRLEDKGEFRCEVHSDTDSANTTARIAALGYSSLHWLILGLCIAVTPVVLLSGAFSVWHCIMEDKRKQALLSHCSHVTVPPIMVSAAFILWGVTEGSAGEAVTCVVISLLNILLLFIMAPYVVSTEAIGEMKYVTVSLGNIFVITVVCVGSLIEFSTKYSPTTTDTALFGFTLGGIILVFIIFVIIRIIRYVRQGLGTKMEIRGTIAKITGIIILIIMVVSIGAVIFILAKNHSARKEQFGTFLYMLMIPICMILFPIIMSVFWILLSLKTTGELGLRDILKIWAYFIYNRKLFNILILAIYTQLFAWMQNTFILGYSIPIAVAALGICACISVKYFFWYLVVLKRVNTSLKGIYYFAQKILLGIFFLLHLILSFLYLSVIIENDRGRPVKMCEFVFINILTLTSCFQDWKREKSVAKPRKFLYFSGTFALPLLNSVALAVALKLKADTGKQPLDLRLIVLISGSVFLFGWFVIQISAYWLEKKTTRIKEEFAHLRRPKNSKRDQGSHDNEETVALSPTVANGPNTEEGSHQNQEVEASSPADHNEPNPEEVLLGEKNTEG
ncbi:uncharacterized protein LOC125704998 [Brienomyrus brachyistius]|uniref:uncharacterized protein LOC125704998 n=1 Tax=Brienomyrus brachyistius TaxID=42636 RepID=UPI0020B1ADFA|nr:uncharacterized protein LOC125704998 [Brienomyrus brachyistius]